MSASLYQTSSTLKCKFFPTHGASINDVIRLFQSFNSFVFLCSLKLFTNLNHLDSPLLYLFLPPFVITSYMDGPLIIISLWSYFYLLNVDLQLLEGEYAYWTGHPTDIMKKCKSSKYLKYLSHCAFQKFKSVIPILFLITEMQFESNSFSFNEKLLDLLGTPIKLHGKAE